MGCYHASETGGGSALNQPRRSTSVRLSRLDHLSFLMRFACSPSLNFSCITPSACSAMQCLSWYIDITITFPQVPVRNSAARVVARQRVPIHTPSSHHYTAATNTASESRLQLPYTHVCKNQQHRQHIIK